MEIGTKMSNPSVYAVTVSAASAPMSCPASAGAAETANGAVERMVLLGLTGVYYIKFGWGAAARGRNAPTAPANTIL